MAASTTRLQIEEVEGDTSSPVLAQVSSNKSRNGKFTFHSLPVPQRSLALLEEKEPKQLFSKWGLLPQALKIGKFRYEEFLDDAHTQSFLQGLFNAKCIEEQLPGLVHQPVREVDFERVPATVTSMSFFDRLALSEEVVYEGSGHIRKCLEEFVDDVPIGDNLRKALLVEESELYELVSEEDRAQFIFHLFANLVVGGQLCQYEDSLAPYLELTKRLYKELLTVRRSAATGTISVASTVFRVEDVEDDEDQGLFARSNTHNRCFVIVEPVKRHVTLYHFSYRGSW